MPSVVFRLIDAGLMRFSAYIDAGARLSHRVRSLVKYCPCGTLSVSSRLEPKAQWRDLADEMPRLRASQIPPLTSFGRNDMGELTFGRNDKNRAEDSDRDGEVKFLQ